MEDFLRTINLDLVWFWRVFWILLTWVIIFLAVRYFGRIMTHIIFRAQNLKVTTRYLKSVDRLIDILLVITGVVITMLLLDFHQIVLGLLTTAGIFSIAVGIAARPFFEKVFAGISLLFERPFDFGDEIEVSFGLNRYYVGKVNKMTILATQIITDTGAVVSIPNNEMVKAPILNKSMRKEQLLKISVALRHDKDLDKALHVLRKLFDKETRLLSKYQPEFIVKEAQDYAADIYAKAKVKRKEKDEIMTDMLQNIATVFHKKNIQLAVPLQETAISVKEDQRAK